MSTSVSLAFADVTTSAGVSLGTIPPPGLPSLPSFVAASVAVVLSPIVTSAKVEPSGTAMILAGCYMGEGQMPVSDKLVKKIVKLEFVEMQELHPELRQDKTTRDTVLTLMERIRNKLAFHGFS